MCDLVADTIVDAYLAQDPDSRAGCEVLYKGDLMVIAGEVTTAASIDIEALARAALDSVGYRPGLTVHNSQTVRVQTLLTPQSREIREAADRAADDTTTSGASDQGIMFGFACRDTPELMPLPISLAHRLGTVLAEHRHNGEPAWLRPDGKAAVTVQYVEHRPLEVTNVLVAVQHTRDVTAAQVRDWVRDRVVPKALGEWFTGAAAIHVNPSGSFTLGGPEIDCGMTGRKLVVDTYGGMARIGGGSAGGGIRASWTSRCLLLSVDRPPSSSNRACRPGRVRSRTPSVWQRRCGTRGDLRYRRSAENAQFVQVDSGLRRRRAP